MNQGLFSLTFAVPGTLAANHIFPFRLAVDATLIHVSAGNTSANAGTLKVGKSTDDDAFLTAMNFGVSNASAEASLPTDFAGADAASQYPRMSKDVYYMITITDHASHMANAYVTLTFDAG